MMNSWPSRPLLQLYGQALQKVRFVPLGDFPTPVMGLSDGGQVSDLFVKRDDLSSPVYGGNKVRTLEVLFGAALAAGKSTIVSVGAFGSNHSVATCLLAPDVGLNPVALAFPQPPSATAAENFRVALGRAQRLVALRHWSALPLAMWRWRKDPRAFVMPPGGANPTGALGYVSAALELAEQVRSGQLPAPERIVVPVGSTCTTAGLLVGLRVARRANIAFTHRLPLVHAVRVTPWPVTSAWRIGSLAQRASELLADLTGDSSLRWSAAALRAGLLVDGRFLGAGYGRATAAGAIARQRLGDYGATLDTTYSEKAAAGLLQIRSECSGPLLLWATKSSAPLPPDDPDAIGSAPSWVRRWLTRCG